MNNYVSYTTVIVYNKPVYDFDFHHPIITEFWKQHQLIFGREVFDMEYNNFGKNKLFSQVDNRHEKREALEIHHFKSEFYVQYRHIQAIILPSP